MDWEYEDELMTAVRSGSADAVRNALQASGRLTAYSKYGETPLGLAAQQGDIEMMRFLADLGVDLDEDDYEGDTPLHKAAWAKQYVAVNWLLEQGTEDMRTKRAGEALQLAAEFGDVRLARDLLDSGAAVDTHSADWELTPLYIAVQQSHPGYDTERIAGRVAVARLLIERGANVHFCHKVTGHQGEPFDAHLISIVRAAARAGNKEVVTMLRQAGAVITLIEAAEIGDIEAVRELLARGDAPNAPDYCGASPLYLAADKGHAEVVRLLLERGADPYAINENRETALSAAANAEHFAVVDVFLDHALTNDAAMYRLGEDPQEDVTPQTRLAALLVGRDQDINPIDPDGLTPLSQVAADGSITTARLLLQAGADVNLSNQYGYTPLICAAEKGWLEMTRLLLSTGADANLVKEDSRSALFCAIGDGMRNRTEYFNTHQEKHAARAEVLALIKLLIEHGADVNIRTGFNSTPLEYALGNGHEDIADLLRAAGATTSEAE